MKDAQTKSEDLKVYLDFFLSIVVSFLNKKFFNDESYSKNSFVHLLCLKIFANEIVYNFQTF